jgi:formamidopyrimidine-DNA glycosylase
MPELPEVEALARWLRPQLVGQRLEALEIHRPLVFRNLMPNLEPADALVGRTVLDVTRRAKFLLISFEEDFWLAVHFMLAGNLEPCEPGVRDPASGITTVCHSRTASFCVITTSRGWARLT